MSKTKYRDLEIEESIKDGDQFKVGRRWIRAQDVIGFTPGELGVTVRRPLSGQSTNEPKPIEPASEALSMPDVERIERYFAKVHFSRIRVHGGSLCATVRELHKRIEAQEMYWSQFYGDANQLRKGALAIMHLKDRAEKAERLAESLKVERDSWKTAYEQNMRIQEVSNQIVREQINRVKHLWPESQQPPGIQMICDKLLKSHNQETGK